MVSWVVFKFNKPKVVFQLIEFRKSFRINHVPSTERELCSGSFYPPSTIYNRTLKLPCKSRAAIISCVQPGKQNGICKMLPKLKGSLQDVTKLYFFCALTSVSCNFLWNINLQNFFPIPSDFLG